MRIGLVKWNLLAKFLEFMYVDYDCCMSRTELLTHFPDVNWRFSSIIVKRIWLSIEVGRPEGIFETEKIIADIFYHLKLFLVDNSNIPHPHPKHTVKFVKHAVFQIGLIYS